MASLAELMVKVGADISEFTQQMDKVQSSMSEAGKSLQNTGKKMTGIGKSLTMSVTAPLVGLGTTAVVIGAKFDAQMSKVAAVSGATGKEFDALRDQAKQLGSTTVWSASEAAAGMEFLARAGWNTTEIMAAMPNVLNLATAGAIDLATASDIASNIISGFGDTAENSQRYIDVMAKTTASANTDINQLGDAMKYVAPVASTMGWSVEETAAAIGKMSDAGIQGSQAGTSLRAGLLRLVSPSKEARGMMDELKMSMFDAEGQMKSLPEVIGELETATKGMTDEQKAHTLATIFGAEAVSGWMAMLDVGSEGLAEFTGELEGAEGTAQSMADTMGDNLAGAFKGLLSALEGVAISFSDVMTPAIRKATEFITDMVRKFDDMSPATKGVIVIVGLLVASIAPLLIVIGLVMQGVGGLMVAFGAVSAPIVALIAIAGVLVWYFKDEIIALFKTAMEWVQPIMDAFKYLTGGFDQSISDAQVYGATVEEVIGTKAMKVVEIFNKIKAKAEEIWQQILDIVVPILTGIKDFVLFVLETVTEFWNKYGDEILAKATSTFETIKSTITPILKDVQDFIKKTLDKIKKFWNENGEQIMEAVSNAFQFILSVIEFVMPAVKFVIDYVWSAIKNIIGGALDFIMGLVKVFSGLFTGDFSKMWEGVKQMFSGAIEFVWGLMNLSFVGAIRKLVVNFAKNIVKTISTKWKDIKGFFTSGKDDALNIVTQLKDKATGFFNGLRDSVKSIFEKIKGFITDPIKTAKDTVLGIIDDIVGAFAGMKIKIPKFKLPKISMKKETGLFGIPYPSFDVSWNAKGAIFNGATILGGGQGVAEKGAEAVLPIQHKRYMAPFAKAVADNLPEKESGGNIHNEFNIAQMVIREEADIDRVAEKLHEKQMRTNRRGGRN